ncbi:MAG TPA: SRPBCC family protein [Trueperaceae bacterium]
MGDAANLPGAGTLTRAPDGRYRVRFVRAYDRPVADLWEAITEPERLDTWYPAKLRTSGVVGEPVTEAFESTDGTPPPEAPPGTLTVFQPPHVFAFEVYGPPDSPYPGMRGRQDIRMEAREGSREDESVFTFTHDVETLEAALSVLPGWHYCLEYLALNMGADGGPTEENLGRYKEYYQRTYGGGVVDAAAEP